MQDEYLDDDFFESPCDDVCCFEPGYQFGDVCHCQQAAEIRERKSNIFYRIWDEIHTWIWIKKVLLKEWLFAKTTCDECGEETPARKWHYDKCPVCRERNLPF